MVLRTPPLDLNPELALEGTKSLEWQTLDCQLVTPMYGGGVKAHTVDEKMPIRISSIRGQLRFWWRLLATHLWKMGDTKAIRQAEADLWGGIDDKTKASKVFLRVDNVKNLQIEAWATYEPNHKGRETLKPKTWADVPYALFPAQGRTKENPNEDPHELAKEGLNWQLDIAFAKRFKQDTKKPEYDPNITPKQEEQVWQAMRWWSQFGGLGARTRRGLGAVQLKQVIGSNAPTNLCTPISTEEAIKAGCQLVIRTPQNTADSALQGAIEKLQKFRQVDIGRANHSSRSRWPEPDAIRRIKRQYLILDAKTHAPIHKAGSLFPRAAFGLPIIFKFKDDKLKRDDAHGDNRPEPKQTSLQPIVNGLVKERMASPIILRPFYTVDKKWAAAALLLPHSHMTNLSLDLSDDTVTYWNPAQAGNVAPIAQHNGTDALTAFMNYFAK